jgi:hypothetical protein
MKEPVGPLSHYIMDRDGIVRPNPEAARLRAYIESDAEQTRILLERVAPWAEGPMRATALEELDAALEPLRVEFRRLGDKYLAPVVEAMTRGLNWLSRKVG